MGIEQVSFKGYDNYNYYGNTNNPYANYSSQQAAPVDEEKSNAAKYMIGATALAGIITLGVLGYKGKLGDGIQKLMKGTEKAAEEATGKGEKAGKKAGEKAGKAKKIKFPKNLEYKIVKEKGIYKIKVPSEIEGVLNLSAEEFEKLEKININGHDCRILSKHKNGKPKLVIAEGRGYIEEYHKKTGNPIRSYENFINSDDSVRLCWVNEYDKNIPKRVTKTIHMNAEGEIDNVKQFSKYGHIMGRDSEGNIIPKEVCIEEYTLAADGKTKINCLETEYTYDMDNGTDKIYDTISTNYRKGKRTSRTTKYNSGYTVEETFYPGGKKLKSEKNINSDGSYDETHYYKNGGTSQYIEVDEFGTETENISYPKEKFRNTKRFFRELFSRGE